jgi:hypothetical protein
MVRQLRYIQRMLLIGVLLLLSAVRDAAAADCSSVPTPMKGMNLGGWLVLESWITPSLFHTYEVSA